MRKSFKESERQVLYNKYLLFTNWVQGLYQEVQALGFPNSPHKLGLWGDNFHRLGYGMCHF